MIIKRISKELIAEGLTLELINSININKHKPSDGVQIEKGDKPVKIMPCANGFWVMYEQNKFLKDKKNNLMVFSEKTCLIARARYLINYGEIEKERKVKELVQHWTAQVVGRINHIKKTIENNGHNQAFSTYYNAAMMMHREVFELAYKAEEESVKDLKEAIPLLEKLLSENKIQFLLELFKIKVFDNPMLVVKEGDKQGMKALINTFHKKELEKWDGDMLNRFARIEVELEYFI